MRKVFIVLLTVLMMMSCTDKPITMNLYYTGENGNARKFVEEMESSGTADAIRAEKGNLRYDYFFSKDNPETVLLIDSWASQKALDAHHATPIDENHIVTSGKIRSHHESGALLPGR